MELDLWQIATTLVGGLATLAIFSFLIGENKYYRFFEHLFIGISAGLLPILTIRDFFWPKIFEPMLGLDIVTYPDGTTSMPYASSNLLYILPIIFGLFYYAVYFKRISWLSRVVIGFTLGLSGSLAFKGFFAEVIPQIAGSFKPFVVFIADSGAVNWGKSVSNVIFVFTLLTVMYYFFFTLRGKGTRGGVVSTSGRWLMMICFGAFFGSTVVARLALLVERIEFLVDDFSTALVTLGHMIF